MIETLKHTDTAVFLYLNGKHNEFMDVVMHYASHKLTWIPLYALLLFLVWRSQQKKTLLVLLAVALMILIVDQVSVHCFKELFQRYRPCHNLEIKDSVHLVDGCGGLYGFVSSHAANTFSLAAFISLVFRKRKCTVLLFLWAGFVSYSRIYTGVHYPADIVGGAILGLIVAFLIWKLYSWVSLKNLLNK